MAAKVVALSDEGPHGYLFSYEKQSGIREAVLLSRPQLLLLHACILAKIAPGEVPIG